jgi:hypothetical protein
MNCSEWLTEYPLTWEVEGGYLQSNLAEVIHEKTFVHPGFILERNAQQLTL